MNDESKSKRKSLRQHADGRKGLRSVLRPLPAVGATLNELSATDLKRAAIPACEASASADSLSVEAASVVPSSPAIRPGG
jgi:hypothetical protein